MKDIKKYYYIAVKTNEGCSFVTSRNNSNRTCFWNSDEKPLAMTKSVADDTAFGLICNGYFAFVVEALINPISDQFLTTERKHSTECKVKVNGGYIFDMHFAYNDDFCEGCDNGVYYDIYDKDGNEIDGGQMDFNSEEKNYADIKDAILDVLEFACYIGFTKDDYEIISEE